MKNQQITIDPEAIISAAQQKPVIELQKLEACKADYHAKMSDPDPAISIPPTLYSREVEERIAAYRTFPIESRQKIAGDAACEKNVVEFTDFLNKRLAEATAKKPSFMASISAKASDISKAMFSDNADRYALSAEREAAEEQAELLDRTIMQAQRLIAVFRVQPSMQTFRDAASLVDEVGKISVPASAGDGVSGW
jgi:hypothetical protein